MSKGKPVEVVRYDGNSWQSMRCTIGQDGVMTEAAGRYVFGSDACIPLRDGLYVLPVAEATLRSESDFHRLRKRVVLRSLFSGGGDLEQWVQTGGMVALLLIALVLVIQVGGMRGDVSNLQAQDKALNQQVQQAQQQVQRLSVLPVVPTGGKVNP